MGVRILNDKEGMACFYCSTSGWAFGPVFYDGGQDLVYRSAEERAEAFLGWLKSYEPEKDDRVILLPWTHDPRRLTDAGLERAYSLFMMQEADLYAKEDADEVEA